MLKQHRISSQSGVENSQVKNPFECHQHQSDGDNRRAQNKNYTRGVMSPDEKRQTKPGHPGRAHFVNRDNEVEPGENRRESSDEDPNNRQHDMSIGINAAVSGIEGPS